MASLDTIRQAPWLLAACVVSAFCGRGMAQTPSEAVDFNRDIRPIFASHCVACHGGVKQAGGLSFIYRDKALSEAESGLFAIVPEKPEESELIVRVSTDDEGVRMPPEDHGPALSSNEIELLTRWIEQGAVWGEHWAFVAPQPQQPPEIKNPDRARDLIDAFLLARLDAEGIAQGPEGDRAEWLRRVTFDLTGLPPTPEEQQQFEADSNPDAYERVVDRLLASPHYGERWAAVWLDLSRYADTMGFEKDAHRNIWQYRDWLIRAFNDDLPYDVFTVKQLAGDLLPGERIENQVASAFNRNTQTNTEGGTDDEEFRVAAVVDRVSTTWQIWQGVTFGCTQCHSHPYDPIEFDEYYQFLSFFNTSRDADLPEEFPTLAVPNDPADWPRASHLDEQIGALRREIHSLVIPHITAPNTWVNLPVDRGTASETARIRIAQNEQEQVTEFFAEGTIANNTVFNLESPVPESLTQMTALRIDSLPVDLEAALRNPESGFCISRLKVTLVAPGDESGKELTFSAAWCDEAEPLLDPEDSLNDDANGWADYTRQTYPRFAVFVLQEPVALPAGSRLKFELRQSRFGSGGEALVIDRGRFAASSSDVWPKLLQDSPVATLRSELAERRRERSAIISVSTLVMKEQPPDLARPTFTFVRGNWLDKGELVAPGVPAVMNALPPASHPNRLAVAHWLMSKENPLTARVMANRVWEQLFGVGIVETMGDFGTSGSLPSHPELLDALAIRFQNDQRWSVKRLIRSLVLSAAYRQSDKASPEIMENDPRNRLLARGPRQRLQAEMVRDQALMLSGRFSPTLYGPPVMPPQPEGLWRSVYNIESWKTATDENRYRRAIYTYWKRTSPYPSMLTFDAPSRDVCTVQRAPTNTPLQALVTLNDPAFVELADAFALRMRTSGGEFLRDQIAWGYRQATGQSASDADLNDLERLLEAAWQACPQELPSEGVVRTQEEFALGVVALAILNLDEVLTR